MAAEVSHPLFDRELALERVGGDIELLTEIAKLFLNEYPKMLTEIKAATLTADCKRLESNAHGLKGSVSNFGAEPAVEAARQLETMGRSQQWTEVEQTVRALELALASLHPELEAL